MWTVALAVACASLVGLEVFWQSSGYRASVADDDDLWAYERSRVYRGGTETLVVTGFSRIRTNFATRTFRDHYPDYDVVQLAVNGKHPIAALRDLALDEDFTGVVLCSVLEISFLPWVADAQRAQVDHFHRTQPIVRLERALLARLEERWAILNERLRLIPMAESLATEGQLPKFGRSAILADRSVERALSLEDRAKMQRQILRNERRIYRVMTPPKPKNWLRLVSRVEPLVERIRARGGEVVFLRVPVAPALYAVDDHFFPKEKYWDRMTEATTAVVLHFEDMPGMADLDFPDLSHLNYSEAPRFTLALADELVRRGVLRAPP